MSGMSPTQPWGGRENAGSAGAEREFEDNFSPTDELPDTQDYVASLESKLAKLKGRGREVTAREMLSVLEDARQDHTARLISCSNDLAPEATAYLPGEDCSDAPIHSTYLKKRLFPERQALTQEELKYLLEADFLEKNNVAASGERSDRASISSGDSEPNR